VIKLAKKQQTKEENKLTKLVEQASLTINMAEPDDLADLKILQNIIHEIEKNIGTIAQAPTKLMEQVKGTTSDTAEMLHKILKKETKDSDKSVEKIATAVSELQGLIEQIEKNNTSQVSLSESPTEDKNVLTKNDPEISQDSTKPQTQEQTESSAQESLVIDEEDVPLVLDFVAEANEHIESAEAGLLELENAPEDNETLNQIFRAFHTIKGMAGFLNLSNIGSLAHSAENLLDMARKAQLVLDPANTDVIFESIDLLKNMISELKKSVEAGKPVKSCNQLTPLLEKLKKTTMGDSTPQKATETDIRQQQDTQTAHAEKNEQNTEHVLQKKGEPKAKSPTSDQKTHTSDEKIKVSTNRLDKLINMAGELVIAQLMVAEDVKDKNDQELNRKVAHQGKITRDLQELSMSMRMVPIQGVFQKMARLVRDLSHKAGKEINFSTVGDETELDRSIVDKIADPLVHMVRNSIDHGIEAPQDRIKANKSKTGTIELKAFHQAGSIVVEITDDGKGLDKNNILKKAIDNGIVGADQELSDEEIYKLVFHAGLSTAKRITSISGRGVGMDVVKKNIDALHGKVDITSKLGKGSTFTIRLPLTLAIIDGQIVKIGNERFIIPITSLVQSLRPNQTQISTIHDRQELVMVRGELMPMVRLYKLFDQVPTTEDPTEALLVIVEEENKKCCLLVDELMGQQQVVIKSLGEQMANAQGISGGAIMGDGRISLILDVPGIMELAQN
jgi:two-component system chemotaxis sensor kinase CheA